MKKMILTLLLPILLDAYELGEKIDDTMMAKLSSSQEHLVIVDFFASWCASCKKEIPLISQLYSKLDKSHVKVIGVDVDDDIQEAQKFQHSLKKQQHLNFPVINDSDHTIVKAFNPIAMPALFFIHKGRVVKVIYGAVDAIDSVVLKEIARMESGR